MPSFKDINGREWTIKIDAPLVKEIRQSLDGFDILADEAFQKLSQDDVLLVDCLYLLCRPQQPGISGEDFAAAIANGDVLEAACTALIDARRFFFRPSRRSLLVALETEQKETIEEGIAIAKEKVKDRTVRDQFLAALKTRMETDLATAMQTILTGAKSATNSPVLSESPRQD